MGKYLLFFASIFIFSCTSSRHYTQLTTGKWISKKEYNRLIQKAVDTAWSRMSEQDKEILNDTSYRFILVIPDSTNQ